MLEKEKVPLIESKAMKSYQNARKCKSMTTNGKYKIDPKRHYNVHLTGLLGKLPKSEDIQKTSGEKFDLLSAFQTYFLYAGDIYQLTTYMEPLEKLTAKKNFNQVSCFLVLGNEHMF